MNIKSLNKVVSILEEAGVNYWVTGGFAIDLAVGRITREHKDIDLLIKINDLGRAVSSFESHDYIIDYVHDKIIASKNNVEVNLISVDEHKGKYVVSTLNVDAYVPKKLLDKDSINELGGNTYHRIPNELIQLFNRYAINQKDAIIARNLPVNQELLSKINVMIKPR